MEPYVLIAIAALVLLVAELLLPTAGALAAIGTAGLIGAGILALNSDSGAGDYAGPGLITAGVLGAIASYVIARKVLAAHRDQPVRTGSEELIGATAEARTSVNPDGQVWLEGALWGARLATDADPIGLGDRVTVEAVDGLTLVVRPLASAQQTTR